MHQSMHVTATTSSNRKRTERSRGGFQSQRPRAAEPSDHGVSTIASNTVNVPPALAMTARSKRPRTACAQAVVIPAVGVGAVLGSFTGPRHKRLFAAGVLASFLVKGSPSALASTLAGALGKGRG